MKKVILGIGLSIFVLASVMAQDRKDLKGPAHKNYKPWKNKQTEKVITTIPADRKGPEAKNYKPWSKSDEIAYYKEDKVVVTNVSTDRPKGPKAKNIKPWDDNKSDNNSENSNPQIANNND